MFARNEDAETEERAPFAQELFSGNWTHTQALRLLYVVDAPKLPKLMKDHRAGEFICGSFDRLAEVKLVLPMET